MAEQAVKMRQVLEHSWILVPGYSAQGGTAADCAKQFKRTRQGNCKMPPITNVPTKNKRNLHGKFEKTTRQEALRMRDDLIKALRERDN